MAVECGLPVMRAMLLEFPDDPVCRVLDRQYMLGPSLLVAPVFQENGEVEFYLPPGLWAPLAGGDAVQGGGWRRERHDFRSLPLYLREGTLLAWGAEPGGEDTRPERDLTRGLELQLFALPDGGATGAVVRDRTGAPALTATVRRAAGRYAVSLRGDHAGCRLFLRGVSASPQTAGIVAERGPAGTVADIPPGVSDLEFS